MIAECRIWMKEGLISQNQPRALAESEDGRVEEIERQR